MAFNLENLGNVINKHKWVILAGGGGIMALFLLLRRDDAPAPIVHEPAFIPDVGGLPRLPEMPDPFQRMPEFPIEDITAQIGDLEYRMTGRIDENVRRIEDIVRRDADEKITPPPETPTPVIPTPTAPARVRDEGLIGRLHADIARVEARRHLPETQRYLERFDGVDAYLASQRRRLAEAGGAPIAPAPVTPTPVIPTPVIPTPTAPARVRDEGLIGRLHADIARVEARRHLPETQRYLARFGGGDAYLASQRRRLAEAGGAPIAPAPVTPTPTAPARVRDVGRLHADIARVEARRHLPETQRYLARFGGVDAYLASQRRRLAEAGG